MTIRRTSGRNQAPIQIQISATIQAPRNGRRIPESIVREAIIAKSQGIDTPGIDLQIVSWQHGSGPTIHASNSADEWQRFARFLHRASVHIVQAK